MDGYYFLDAEPGAYTLNVEKFTPIEGDYPGSKTPTMGEIKFDFVEMPLDRMFAYGHPKQKEKK